MGVSTDSGETWRFLEVTSLDENLFRLLFGFVDQALLSELYQYTSERNKCPDRLLKKEPLSRRPEPNK
jgi:hypothetical protein